MHSHIAKLAGSTGSKGSKENTGRRAGLSIAAAVTLTGGLLTVPTAGADTPGEGLNWAACPPAAHAAPDALCADLEVPQDYSNPGGSTITLTMSKIPAKGQSRGVIVGNPGGPGGDALSMFAGHTGSTGDDEIYDARVKLPQRVRDNYDQIAVEPRGLAYGGALTCNLDGIGGIAAQFAPAGVVRDMCNQQAPGLVDQVTTENTARDLDEARKVLGQDKISLYGLSYGGLLMSTYATMFPEHTDKTLLDSSAAQDGQWFGLGDKRRQDRRDALDAMFQWIADHNDTYGLGTTKLQVYQRWSDRIAQETGVPAQVTPPPAQVGDLPPALQARADVALPAVNQAMPATWRLVSAWHTLTTLSPKATEMSPLFSYTMMNAIYSDDHYDKVATYIRDGKSPDPVPELPDDEELQRQMITQSITMGTVEMAIVCNENREAVQQGRILPFLVDSYTGGDVLNLNGDLMASGQMCAGWPLPRPAMDVSGDALETKPLLVGYSHDSAVSGEAIWDMQRRMGGEAVVVDGRGHGVLVNDSDQVAEKVNAYFGV